MAANFISIIIPSLNEEKYIGRAIRSLLPNGAAFDCEILVMDGGSTDRTITLVQDLIAGDSRIKLIHNPRRLQSAAVNSGAELADPRSRILVRADSHAVYPPDFVGNCVRALEKTGAKSVVVTMNTEGVGWWQRGVAAAQNSIIGNGGSAHRRPGLSRFVDHGHHAAFDRDFFRLAGGYDETMPANEDVDLDARIVRAGGKIWLETSISMTYYPRDSAWGLMRQYFYYGRGRALTFRRHRYALKLRQLAPLFIFVINGGALSLSVLTNSAFLIAPMAYLLLCFGWGAIAASSRQDLGQLALGPAAVIMHHAWAMGFLTGFVETRTVTSGG
jgi:succinoglycan biosynthesis protein ExoA